MRKTEPVPAAAPKAPISAIAPPVDGVQRRRLLVYALSSPVLTLAAGFGADTAAAGSLLPPLVLTPPDTVDLCDIADTITLAALPTMPLVRLTVQTNGRIVLELPRLESGQGIATACAMMVVTRCRCRWPASTSPHRMRAPSWCSIS